MGVLELYRGGVAESGVKATVVVPVDPAGGRVLDVGDRLVGPGVEDRCADALGLVEADDRLHESVVVGIPDAADRGRQALQHQVVGVAHRGVLRPRIRMSDQPPG